MCLTATLHVTLAIVAHKENLAGLNSLPFQVVDVVVFFTVNGGFFLKKKIIVFIIKI